jgi:transposase-like protein
VAGKINWTALRREWEAGATLAGLARTYNVSEQQIRKRKAREGWTKGAPAPLGTEASSDAPGSQPAHRGNLILLPGGTAKREDTLPLSEDQLTHEALERKALRIADALLTKTFNSILNSPVLRPGNNSSEAGEIKDAIAAVSQVVAMGREIAGLRSGDPSNAEAEQTEENGKEYIVVVKAGEQGAA